MAKDILKYQQPSENVKTKKWLGIEVSLFWRFAESSELLSYSFSSLILFHLHPHRLLLVKVR